MVQLSAVDINNAMGERQNTFVCAFDPQSPRISAYEIHEWVFETLCLQESEVKMIQIDGPKRQVYIKVSEPLRMQELLTSTEGQAEYRHTNGVISKVRIEAVGLGLRKIRIANLPPELPERNIRMALRQFGEIREIHNDTWSNKYRYPVSNGIRITSMNLVQHIPSHLMVAGHRTLITYEGQPTTCFGCNEIGHLYQMCPHRKHTGAMDARASRKSWAEVATTGAADPMDTKERSDRGTEVVERAAAAPEVEGGPNSENQERNKPTTRCEKEPMTEAMQITELVEESRDNTCPLMQVEEHQVRSETDMEGDDVRVEDVAAEGQPTIRQTALGRKQRPSKEEGTRKSGGVNELGGEGRGSESATSEEVAHKTTPPGSPKPTKKLRVELETSPPARRKSRTRTRTTTTSTQ